MAAQWFATVPNGVQRSKQDAHYTTSTHERENAFGLLVLLPSLVQGDVRSKVRERESARKTESVLVSAGERERNATALLVLAAC